MRFQFSRIKRFLSKLPGFSKSDKYPLAFLNVAQFTGVLNDNIYKLVLVFFLIGLKGPDNANTILSTAGAIFVIPFLLFSSIGGSLADRFSKSRLITLLKAAEICLFGCVIVAFAFKLVWGGYLLLFFLSTHSALFGPSKYGIIPELVPKSKISKANGLIIAFTYLAIIIGTFLASFITGITGRNYVLVACFCFLFSIIGFLSTFGIPVVPAKNTKEEANFSFFRQIFHTLKECQNERHLLTAISGSSFFLFVGAYTQLNIIPFGMQALHLSEVAGGYLFLVTALGIALGAFLAGRASKALVELGLSCLASLFLVLMLFFLSISGYHVILTLLSLFLLGVFGGCFVVPLDSFIQSFSPEATRGHVIAATNFLSFCGVLLASFAIYFLNDLLGLSAAGSFGIMAVVTLGFSIFLFLRLSDLFFSYLTRKLFLRIFEIDVKDLFLVETSSAPFLIFENPSLLAVILLHGFIPNLHVFVPYAKKGRFGLHTICYSIHKIISLEHLQWLLQKKRSTSSTIIPCLYVKKELPANEKTFWISTIRNELHYDYIAVDCTRISSRNYSIRFTRYSS